MSTLALGVGVGSTDTTDRIGKTRSEADGLIAPNEDSNEDDGIGELVPWLLLSCGFDLQGWRCVSKPHNFCSWEGGSEKEG